MRFVLVVALVFGVGLVGAASAGAAVERFAGPGSSDTSGPCTSLLAPCAVRHAIQDASPGDTVTLLPGDYGTIAGGVIVVSANNLVVRGQPGQPRPLLTVPAAWPDAALRFDGLNGTARSLELRNPSGQGVAFAQDTDQVIVTAGGDLAFACSSRNGGVVRNSVCLATGANATAAGAASGGNSTDSLRNVTAIATGPNSVGVQSNAGSGATVTVNAINTIASGVSKDVLAYTSNAASHATLNIGYSNFRTQGTSGPGTNSVNPSPPGTNQTAAPVFADATYHEASASPTIDAGVNDPANGAFDLDGNPRILNGRTDIGAYEFVPPPGSPPPLPVLTTPRITAASMVPRTWRLGGRLPGLSRRAPVGTTIAFRLSETARVRLDFLQPRPGRRVGRRCVPPSRGNARKRRCTRVVGVGSLSFGAHAGLNEVRFQGRLSRRKRLSPGSYKMTITAANPAGRHSTTRPISFKILPAQ